MCGSVTAPLVRSLSAFQQDWACACSNSLLPETKTSTHGAAPKSQFLTSVHLCVGQQCYSAIWLSPEMYPHGNHCQKDIGRQIINIMCLYQKYLDSISHFQARINITNQHFNRSSICTKKCVSFQKRLKKRMESWWGDMAH